MTKVSETLRKATTFLLALFLWLHMLFFWDVNSTVYAYAQVLRLTVSEFVLLGLLVVFSLLTASGFWKTLLSLIYIYCFPFVLLSYFLYGCFLILRTIHRWFSAQLEGTRQASASPVKQNLTLNAVEASPTPSKTSPHFAGECLEILRFLLRPFRRFTLLWCILLLVTTHVTIVWLCLIVIMIQIVRKIFLLLKMLLFSGAWWRKFEEGLLAAINPILGSLTGVTVTATPTGELKNLWSQVTFWRKTLFFMKDSRLVSVWAWFLGLIFLSVVYVYFAVLFSFGYYGIGRVSGVAYPWPNALVTSMFIPFFISDLPNILAAKWLAGVHCLLVVTLGVGTFVTFLRRKLTDIRRAATDLSVRLQDQSVQEKYVILDSMFSGEVKK